MKTSKYFLSLSPIEKIKLPLLITLLILLQLVCGKWLIRLINCEYLVSSKLFFSLLFFLPKSKPITSLRTRNIWIYLFGAMASLMSLYCIYITFTTLPLTLIVFCLLVPSLFCPLVFRIWVGKRMISSLALSLLVGFIGIIIFLFSLSLSFALYTCLGIAGVILQTIGYLACKRTQFDSSFRKLSYLYLLPFLISLFFFLGVPYFPSLKEILGMLIFGLLAVLIQKLSLVISEKEYMICSAFLCTLALLTDLIVYHFFLSITSLTALLLVLASLYLLYSLKNRTYYPFFISFP